MVGRGFVFAVAIGLLSPCAPAARSGEVMVGAYYYAWYGPYEGGHNWRDCLRSRLIPPQQPAIGRYSSRARDTIARHIDHSRQGNVSFWAVSWWGPKSPDDFTFRKVILNHPRAGELKYAVHYECTGRLGSDARPNFKNLLPDFRFLARHYFGHPDYLRIDGRPVVFLYVTLAYFNSAAARRAVADLREAMHKEFGLNPYLVGDDLLAAEGVIPERAKLWDAITAFDVYGSVLQEHGSTQKALDHLTKTYDDARSSAAELGIGFIPTATPGFNDKGVRGGHPPAPRYLVDVPDSRGGDLFARMLAEVAVPRTDPRAANILMINSFNEWHEDTQIEPAAEAERTNLDESPGNLYTRGYFYEGYGDKYLNILRDATTATAGR
jgi:hypothetical protein